MPAKQILIIILSALLGVWPRTTFADDYEAFFRRCYDGGLPDQVIASCSVVIARRAVDDQDLATAFKNRGNAFDDKGEYARAVEDYDQALSINPRDSDAYNSRATTYTALNQYDRAIQDLDEAIKLNPLSAIAFSNRCFARAVLDQLEPALADCNESLRLKRNIAGAYASRGFVHLKLRRYDAAITDYNVELRMRPADSYALFGRGIAKQRKGDRRGADADIVAAETIKPDIAEHMARLGVQVRDKP